MKRKFRWIGFLFAFVFLTGYVGTCYVSGASYDLTTVEGVTRQFLDQYITENMTDLEKELMIVRWMEENIRYDESGKGGSDSYEAYGAMVKHCAVCDGYAKTFEILGKACGLNVCKINGTVDNRGKGPENHAWNMILLDGSWYHVDVTWDDPLPEPNGYGLKRIKNAYINLTDAELSATHKWTPVHPSTKAAYGRAVVACLMATGRIDRTMTPDKWRDYVLDNDLNSQYPLTDFGCRYDDGRNFFTEKQTDQIAAYMRKQFDTGRKTCILAIDTADLSLPWFTSSWFWENVCLKDYSYSCSYSAREGYLSLCVNVLN